jgi:flagella basal body P-ring formation protein FlgA
MTDRFLLRTSAARLALAAVAACSVPANGATSVPPAAEPLRAFVERQLPSGTGRVSIEIGQLDPRLQLAPCARVEPHLLPGTRLWGRSAIGVRCVEGARWSVALPVTVTVHGPALVATEALAAGAQPAPGAVRLQEVELTREPGTPVTDPAQLVGRTLTRAVPAGTVLRAEHLRITPTVAAGDPVRVRLIGEGFAIQTEGQLLAAAADGQTVRVRTDGGRVLGGTLRGRTVDVLL